MICLSHVSLNMTMQASSIETTPFSMLISLKNPPTYHLYSELLSASKLQRNFDLALTVSANYTLTHPTFVLSQNQ